MKNLIAGILIATFAVPSAASTPQDQLDCLTRIVEHEAGGESVKGQMAVVYVIMNRIKSKIYPKTVCKVATQSGQFSHLSLHKKIKPEVYNKLKTVALTAKTNYSITTDPTKHALFFANKHVKIKSPYKLTVTIGEHRFYR